MLTGPMLSHVDGLRSEGTPDEDDYLRYFSIHLHLTPSSPGKTPIQHIIVPTTNKVTTPPFQLEGADCPFSIQTFAELYLFG